MTNPIIEEVRAARAALAAEHGYDIRRITEWARAQTAARKAALTKPKPKKSSAAAGGSGKSPVTRKRRMVSARTSS
ncbi:MAG: hypothetical protein R3F13_07195 [Prosthecobacter sp.]